MRILQVAPAYFPATTIGGPIFSILALEKLLISEGHSVDTVTTHLGLFGAEKERFHENVFYESPGGGRVLYQSFYGYPSYTLSPSTLRWLVRNVAEYDFVAIHCVWNFPLLAAGVACALRSIPYVIFPHGTLSIDAVHSKFSTPKAILLAFGLRKVIERSRAFVFTTEAEKADVRQFLRRDSFSVIMPNIVRACDFDNRPARGTFRAHYGLSSHVNILLHYGRAARIKGIPHVLRALSLIRSRVPNLVYVIAGDCSREYRHELELLSIKLGVRDIVLFTGLLSRADGIAALVDADLFVLASASENFGMAVVEAMLCELPVLISDTVGISPGIALAKAGVVVSLTPGGIPLAAALERLLPDTAGLLRLGKAGRDYALAHYDESVARARLAALFDAVKD